MIKWLLKNLINALALVCVWPCSVPSRLEAYFCPGREGWFDLGAQIFSLAPGTLGMYFRRAYYRFTLDSCAPDCFIGFGTVFAHRIAVVESGVYIGRFALIGAAILHKRCLIGSRASLLSAGQLHTLDQFGEWSPTDISRLSPIEVGESAWLGEGAIVMADVGPRAMVSAGAVVSAPVPPEVMVGGNPARFVKRLEIAAAANCRQRNSAANVVAPAAE